MSSRVSVLFFAALLVGASPSACGSNDSQPNAPPGIDGGDANEAAAPESSTPDLPVALTPPIAPLPLDANAVVPVAIGEPTDYDGALLEDTSTGSLAVVFERFLSQTEFTAEIRVAHAESDGKFGASSRVDFGSEPLIAGPHVLVRGKDTFLYFMHGDAAKNRARIARARFSGGAFAASEDLVLADTFAGILAWPCATERGTDVALAYDHYTASQHVALGDGTSFGAATPFGTGVQGRIATMTDGTIVGTWQNGNAADMIAFVRVSKDGATWIPAVPLTTKTNVHDASPFRRADGGVDVYYISTEAASHFRIWRRAVRADASLGPEELVSSESAGAFTQPHPHRLHDGSVGLVFARQVTSNVDTDTYMTRIGTDAPP